MSQKRKNKSGDKSMTSQGVNDPWFVNQVKRQKRRKKLAKLSKRKNRG